MNHHLRPSVHFSLDPFLTGSLPHESIVLYFTHHLTCDILQHDLVRKDTSSLWGVCVIIELFPSEKCIAQ